MYLKIMNYFLVITLLLNVIAVTICRPSDQVEIEKQRLIHFPEEQFYLQNSQQSDDTRRILEEIKKINIALGYVKIPSNIQNPSQNILDPDRYLYPQSSYHPIYSNHKNAINIPPTIRNFEANQPIVARKIVHHHSLMLPEPISVLDNYFYPVQHLRLPVVDLPVKFKNEINETNENVTKVIDNDAIASQRASQKLMAISNDVTSIIEYAPKMMESNENQIREINNEEYKNLLLNNVKQIVEEAKMKRSKTNNDIYQAARSANGRKPIKVTLLPSQLQALAAMQDQISLGQAKSSNKIEKPEENTKLKPILEKAVEGSGKGPFGFLKPHNSLPSKVGVAQITLNKPFKKRQPPTKTPNSNSNNGEKGEEGNDDDDDEDNNDDGNVKGIFFPNRMTDVQKQALKDGGIIIQRLKVRKGGIAIAGPGGVATAGSGGTAIVGPGGVALTHPKSLTIAGPGAKVVALPESFDLEKAILKSKGKSLPEEGHVVATGPAIYYHPENL